MKPLSPVRIFACLRRRHFPNPRSAVIPGPHRWKLCLCLLGLAGSACTQVARQPHQGGSPWWEEGNPPQAEEVQQDTASSDASESLEAAGRVGAERDSLQSVGPASGESVAASSGGPPEEAEAPRPPEPASPPPEVVKAQRQAYGERTQEDRERVRQVNEYALWCVEQGLWEEARIHLEQAVVLDSLSASLHNNLGIVYERLGEREKARAEYEFAARLAPAKRLYQANLGHLHRAAEGAGRVPADSLDIGGLPRAGERRRGTAPARETPEEG